MACGVCGADRDVVRKMAKISHAQGVLFIHLHVYRDADVDVGQDAGRMCWSWYRCQGRVEETIAFKISPQLTGYCLVNMGVVLPYGIKALPRCFQRYEKPSLHGLVEDLVR